MNSLRSSSHLLLGLPTCLLALILLSSPGCQLNTLRFYLFEAGKNSPCHTPLLSSVYFSPAFYFVFFLVFFGFFCAPVDVFDPIFFVFSGVDFFIGIFLERHVAILIFLESCSEPSSVSLSVVPSSSFLSAFSVPSSFVHFHFFGLYFRFVCTIRRSIFRCAVLIIFSCFCVNVHVLLA